MASLDYTNIAGGAFQPYVATQIEKRKTLVDKDNRSSSELLWLSNKNVWVRISSGANVYSGNNNYQGLTGDSLSKKYILQGGLLNHLPSKDTYALRSGVSPDGAYGIGGNDFGLVPMPGLTDISIKTGGKLGTLKEITFNFICHNLEQLNIMEALYMKLGFGVLVEWGHTHYIDNNTGTIQTNIKPLPFYGIHTKEDLMQKITTNRKYHSGNYDASWGTVKNFSYSLDENGRFKCQVQLVGAGDILESLKINVSGEPITPENTYSGSIYPVVSDSNLSLLNNALYTIYSSDYPPGSGNASESFVIDDNYFSVLQPYFNNIGLDIVNWDNNNELKKKGFHFRLINEPNLGSSTEGYKDTNVPPIYYPTSFFSRLIADYEVPGEEGTNISDATKPGFPQVYITLGHLLLLIKSTGMLYQRNEGEGQDKQRPYIYVDVNPETNRCYTFFGHCSLDPQICLIGSERLPFGITSEGFDRIKNNFNWFDDNGDGGRFMYTLVNVDFVASLMKKWRGSSTKGDVYFVDLVKDILDGISKATGGYNEFRIVPDDDSRCIRILDDRRMVGIADPDYTEIPILGKKSIVYNFDYTSKIAPNTAAMIVVAAQAQPYGVQGAENALAFSHLNKGLYNRLDTVVVDSGTENNKTATADSNVQRYIELRDYIVSIYNGTGGASALTEEEVATEVSQADQNAANVPASQSGTDIDDVKFKEIIRTYFLQAASDYRALYTKYPDLVLEKAAMETALNAVEKFIRDSSTETLIDESAGFFRDDNNKIAYSTRSLIRTVNEWIEDEYDSPNFTDSEIEDEFDAYYIRVTGLNGNYF